jgi:hypothetical protein
MAPAVGQDIEALCGRCGTVWHVVMAMMGDRIAKVVCKRCGGHHRYRREGDSEEAAASGGAKSEARPRATTRRYAKAAAPRTPAPLPAFDPNKPPRVYTAKDGYDTGDRVTHPSFGTGIVTGAAAGSGRVEVAFPSGPRVLACAKIIQKIERPVAVAVPIADRPPEK